MVAGVLEIAEKAAACYELAPSRLWGTRILEARLAHLAAGGETTPDANRSKAATFTQREVVVDDGSGKDQTVANPVVMPHSAT
jgi:hypothetical protein